MPNVTLIHRFRVAERSYEAWREFVVPAIVTTPGTTYNLDPRLSFKLVFTVVTDSTVELWSEVEDEFGDDGDPNSAKEDFEHFRKALEGSGWRFK